MPTIAQLRNSIRNQVVGQVPTDDTRLRDRFIDYLIRTIRSQMASEDSSRGTGIDQAFYQTIDCLEVKCGTVKCAGRTMEDTSYVEIPVITSGRDGIAFLGSIDGSGFSRRSLTAFVYGPLANRGGVKTPFFTVMVDRILLKNVPGSMKLLRMHAVLEDPMAKSCLPLTQNDAYPIPDNRVHQLELMCIKQLLATLPITADQVNDAQDDAVVPGRPNPNVQ